MKKTFSILLALVMALTSCFVASAETTETVTNLIGVYGSYDVPTYGWAFNALRTSLQSGDTEQADATYTAEELANTILYNKTGAGYGQWLGIDANTNLFSYEASNFVINQQSYGQSTYGIAFDEKLVDGKVFDDNRIDYYRRHISSLKTACEHDGVDLMGYLAWSPIDFLSSHKEIRKRYGFVYVNRDFHDLLDLKRYPKKSFYWYQRAIASNGEELGDIEY